MDFDCGCVKVWGVVTAALLVISRADSWLLLLSEGRIRVLLVEKNEFKL